MSADLSVKRKILKHQLEKILQKYRNANSKSVGHWERALSVVASNNREMSHQQIEKMNNAIAKIENMLKNTKTRHENLIKKEEIEGADIENNNLSVVPVESYPLKDPPDVKSIETRQDSDHLIHVKQENLSAETFQSQVETDQRDTDTESEEETAEKRKTFKRKRNVQRDSESDGDGCSVRVPFNKKKQRISCGESSTGIDGELLKTFFVNLGECPNVSADAIKKLRDIIGDNLFDILKNLILEDLTAIDREEQVKDLNTEPIITLAELKKFSKDVMEITLEYKESLNSPHYSDADVGERASKFNIENPVSTVEDSEKNVEPDQTMRRFSIDGNEVFHNPRLDPLNPTGTGIESSRVSNRLNENVSLESKENKHDRMETPSNDLTKKEQIPNQPSKIVQSMEKVISNISYIRCRIGVMYKCNYENCRVNCQKSIFQYHLKTRHLQVKWNGFCKLCNKTIFDSETPLDEEFNHMYNEHVMKDKIVDKPEEYETENSDQSENKREPITWTNTNSIPEIPENHDPKPAANNSEGNEDQTLIELTTSMNHLTTLVDHPDTSTLPVTEKVAVLPASSMIKACHIWPLKPSDESSLPESTNPLRNDENSNNHFVQVPTFNLTSKLKPWIKVEDYKNPIKVASMLSEDCLVNLYKCMGSNCDFHSSCVKSFQSHLVSHQLHDNNDLKFVGSCSYCYFSSTNVLSLVQHIQAEHKYERYACTKCFYRSVEEMNLILHLPLHQICVQKDDPDLDPDVIILDCVAEKINLIEAKAEALEGRSKFIRAVKCFECKNKFYHSFMKHYRENHAEAEMSRRCHKCHQKITLLNVKYHLENCIGIKRYHCVYCQFGTMKYADIKIHLITVHPNKVNFFCERMNNKNIDPSSIESLEVKRLELTKERRSCKRIIID